MIVRYLIEKKYIYIFFYLYVLLNNQIIVIATTIDNGLIDSELVKGIYNLFTFLIKYILFFRMFKQ